MELNQLKEIMQAFSQSEFLECRLVTSEVSLELKRTDLNPGAAAGTAGAPGMFQMSGGGQMSGMTGANPMTWMTGANPMPGMSGANSMPGESQADAVTQAAGAAGPSGQAQDNSADCKVVKAPMAGTFYTSAKPGEEPYVTAGSRVSKGDTLGLLEAMKVISEITAPVSGTVQEVLLEDAQFAEYDMPLFRIRET